MITNDLGRVTPIWRGPYSSETAYELNDIVLDAGGSVWWHVSAEATTGVDPAEGEIWAAVIDMRIFSATIQAAIAEARAVLEAAQEAEVDLEHYAERAETAANAAGTSAGAASEFASAAGRHAASAEEAKSGAVSAQTAAQAAKTAAETAQTAAETARTAAETARTGAESARDTALAYKNAAGESKTASEVAAQRAEEAATALEVVIDDTFNVPGTAAESTAVGRRMAEAIRVPESGQIAEFSDGADNRPLTALSVGIEAAQSGSGDPSPENIRPISGFTGAKITRTGKNLWGGLRMARDIADNSAGGSVDEEAGTFTYTRRKGSSAVTVFSGGFRPDTRYTLILAASVESASNTSLVFRYSDDSTSPISVSATGKTAAAYTSAAGKSVVGIQLTHNAESPVTCWYDECGLFEGVLTAEEFEPYRGAEVSVDWESAAGEVYGGTLNVLTGELTVYRAYISLTGTEKWVRYPSAKGPNFDYYYIQFGEYGTVVDNSGISSHFLPVNITLATEAVGQKIVNSSAGGARLLIRPENVEEQDVDEFKAWLVSEAEAGHPVQVVYTLTNPATYQLTPAQLSTLLGENRVWADTGEVDLTYTADTKLYIDNKLAALSATMLENIGN